MGLNRKFHQGGPGLAALPVAPARCRGPSPPAQDCEQTPGSSESLVGQPLSRLQGAQ